MPSPQIITPGTVGTLFLYSLDVFPVSEIEVTKV